MITNWLLWICNRQKVIINLKNSQQIQENPVLEPLLSLKSDVGLRAPVDVGNLFIKVLLRQDCF